MQASKKAKKSPLLSNQAGEPKSAPGAQPPTSAATAKIPVRKRKAPETAPELSTSMSKAVHGETKRAKMTTLHEHMASVASDASVLSDALHAAKHPASAAAMHSRDRKQKAKLNQAPAPIGSSDRDKTAARNTADATPAMQRAARQPIPAAAANAPGPDSSRRAESRREPASKGTTPGKHASQHAADTSASQILSEQSIHGSDTGEGDGADIAGENMSGRSSQRSSGRSGSSGRCLWATCLRR